MKQFLFIAALFMLSSCEVLFPTYTFKVIGVGSFTIGFVDNGGSSVFNGSAQTFKREMSDGETWVLSAQSNSGSGVRVEAYIGNELIKSQSATGYGVASISGTH